MDQQGSGVLEIVGSVVVVCGSRRHSQHPCLCNRGGSEVKNVLGTEKLSRVRSQMEEGSEVKKPLGTEKPKTSLN